MSKFRDGGTGHINYDFRDEGPFTNYPHANLVKAVIEQLSIRVLNKHSRNGWVDFLGIEHRLGQLAVDAVHSLGRFFLRIWLHSLPI